MSSRYSIVLAIVLASGLVLSACKGGDKKKPDLPPATGPGAAPRPKLPPLGKKTTVVAPVARVATDTTGTTFPRAEAAVAPKMSGIIDKVLVNEGDRVTTKTVLFRIRTDDVGLRANQARAGLEAARVRLAAVKVEYDRTKRLFEQSAVNQMAWDKVQAEYRAAQVGVTAALASLRITQQGWADAVVRSPIDGIVTKKLKNAGEMATTMPPAPVVIVEDHSVLELKFQLPEQALRTLAVGDMFNADFKAIGVTRDAKVIRIAPRVNARTRTVEVVAQIDNPSGKLKAGMLAIVKRKTADAPQAAKKAAAPTMDAGAGK